MVDVREGSAFLNDGTCLHSESNVTESPKVTAYKHLRNKKHMSHSLECLCQNLSTM